MQRKMTDVPEASAQRTGFRTVSGPEEIEKEVEKEEKATRKRRRQKSSVQVRDPRWLQRAILRRATPWEPIADATKTPSRSQHPHANTALQLALPTKEARAATPSSANKAQREAAGQRITAALGTTRSCCARRVKDSQSKMASVFPVRTLKLEM